ncbi:MAG: SpoVG family protein [Oscillospiraceae bacterium]
MEIKVTNMMLCNNSKNLKAVASVTLNDEFAINKIKVIESPYQSKLIIALPSFLDAEGKYINYIHPIKNEVREKLDKVILEKYKQMTTGGKTNELLPTTTIRNNYNPRKSN